MVKITIFVDISRDGGLRCLIFIFFHFLAVVLCYFSSYHFGKG